LLLDRAESTDLFVEGHQVLAELLEAVKLGDLLLGFAQGRGIGKSLRHGLAGHAASETELRVVSRVVAFGTVAGRLAAAAHDGGKRAGAQITQAEELFQKLGSFALQSSDIVRHKGFLSVPQIVCTYIDVQNNATKKEIPQHGTSMSPTHIERTASFRGEVCVIFAHFHAEKIFRAKDEKTAKGKKSGEETSFGRPWRKGETEDGPEAHRGYPGEAR
jgi:hypothetical protein